MFAIKVNACDSCARVLVNGAVVDDEAAQSIESSENAIGPVTFVGMGADNGYFDCFFCNDIAIGPSNIFEGQDKG